MVHFVPALQKAQIWFSARFQVWLKNWGKQPSAVRIAKWQPVCWLWFHVCCCLKCVSVHFCSSNLLWDVNSYTPWSCFLQYTVYWLPGLLMALHILPDYYWSPIMMMIVWSEICVQSLDITQEDLISKIKSVVWPVLTQFCLNILHCTHSQLMQPCCSYPSASVLYTKWQVNRLACWC